MKRKTGKWLTTVTSLALLLQAGQPIVSEAMPHQGKISLLASSSSIAKEQSQWNFQAMGTLNAWNEGYTGKGVKIAIIDTGIAPHSELQIAGGISTLDQDSSYEDKHGHGTQLAGIIGAKNNGAGIVGIAPDAKLYAVRALTGFDNGSVKDVIEGIEWSIQNGMDIINLSIGLDRDVPELREAIQKAHQAGILIVASTGNDGRNSPVRYPAKYPEVIAVSTVDQNMMQASFSSGGEEVDFTAPGVDIVTTYLNGQYVRANGTSEASPHIVGILALLKEKFPNKSNVELEKELQKLAKDLGKAGKDEAFGYGFVAYPSKNVDQQVEAVAQENPLSAIQLLYVENAKKYIELIRSNKKASYKSYVEAYINRLPEGQQKEQLKKELQEALDMINHPSNTKAVSPVESTQPEVTASTPSITPDSTLTATQKRYASQAELYIEYIIKYNRSTYANNAQTYIRQLPDGEVKTNLLQKLEEALVKIGAIKNEEVPSETNEQSVQEEVYQAKPSTQETPEVKEEATPQVMKEEPKVEAQPKTEEKPAVTEKLTKAQETYAKYGEEYIERYVSTKNDLYKNTAQRYIHYLPEGPTKERLIQLFEEKIGSFK